MAVLMKIYKFKILLLILSVLICFSHQEENEPPNEEGDFSEEIEEDNGVHVLTDKVFDDFIQSRDVVLVEFYAPWCGHCKQLAPEYEKAAKVLKESTPPVYLAKVDATVQTELAERHDVSGYPTLFVYKNGQKIDYEGPRDADGIVEYMKKLADPSFEPPKESTIVLTNENFTDITNREELMVVMFYAPWCGHCKKLKPEYEKAAKELSKRSPPILLAKVDATVEKDLAELFEVKGYPTLKFFRKGQAYSFKSDARDKYALISYIEKHMGDASIEMKSLKDLKSKVHPAKAAQSPFAIVAFFQNPHTTQFKIYTNAANELRDDYSFMHTFDQSHAKQWNIDANTLAIFLIDNFQTKYEPKIWKLKFDDETTAEEVKEFIQKHKLPLVGEYNSWSKEQLYKETRPLAIFFYTVDWSFEHKDATQQWRQKFADVANKYEDITFVIADDDDNKDLFNQFGFDDSGEEINFGILSKDDRKYPMEPMEEYDADEVHNFIKKFKKGSLKPIIKSQAIPAKQTGPVTVVVGKTFEKIVMDKNKDVLIEMYAPWCGHCKQLEPIYKDLAKKLKSQKNLVIAKMDATANDAPPNYSVSGFPTIYFAPANNKKEPVLFSGDRTVEGFTKFIKEHGTAVRRDEL